MQVELSPQEQNRIEKEPTNSLTAYQFYLKGRDYYYRYGREDIETAVELFSKALEVDPNYALACAGLADAYNQRFIYSGTATTWLDMAIGLSRKAISLDADLSEGYKAMGLAYYLKGWNQRALEAYEKALALDPNNHGAENNMAVVRDKKGKLGEALRGYRRTIVLSPTRPLAHANVGLVYLVLGDDAKAEQWINRGLALNPDNAICRFRLGVLYLRQEEFDLARKQSREIRRNSPNSLYGLNLAGDVELWSGNSLNAKPYYQEAIDLSAPEANPHSRLALGHILWNEGQRSDVQNLFSPLQHHWQQALGQGSESPDLRYNLALMYVVQGNETEAYRWLNEAINAGWRDYRLANRDPRWEKLRHQILFQQMMADVRVKVEEMRRRVREMEKEWDFR